MDGQSTRFAEWAQSQGLEGESFSVEQRVLIGAALHFLEFASHHRLLVRLVVFFLTHCGVDFSERTVGSVVGRTARAVKTTKAASVQEIVESAHRDGARHGAPTLESIHAGPVAEFVFEHRGCSLDDIATFAGEHLGIEVGIDGVRAFLRRHGLVHVRNDEPVAPLL
jgi:hypothetical protein